MQPIRILGAPVLLIIIFFNCWNGSQQMQHTHF